MANKRTRLNLTGVGEVISEQKDKKSSGIPKCDNGLTMEQYEDLNIPYDKIPQELKDREEALNKEDEDLDVEEVYSDVIVYEDEIRLIVEDDEGYTTIFLSEGLLITVLESALEIDAYLDYIHKSWVDKKLQLTKVYFINLFRRIKWKFSKEKKQLDNLTEN